jgi:hypothetical protein
MNHRRNVTQGLKNLPQNPIRISLLRLWVNSPLTWPTSGVRGTIAPDEVHLWAWGSRDSRGGSRAHIKILDRQEWGRMLRFHFRPGSCPLRCRPCEPARRILGSSLQQPAARLRFHTKGFGKPELDR